MTELKLLGCPMCGKQPEHSLFTNFAGYSTHSYLCIDGIHEVKVSRKTRQEAAKAWNTRFNEDNKDGKN